jgi:4-hydroxybenzoate polyprenyltransferase
MDIKMGLKTEFTQGAFDATLASSGGKLAGASGIFTAAASWFAGVNWLTLSGVFVAVGGFIVNAYFNYRRDQREQRESEARLDAIRGKCEN